MLFCKTLTPFNFLYKSTRLFLYEVTTYLKIAWFPGDTQVKCRRFSIKNCAQTLPFPGMCHLWPRSFPAGEDSLHRWRGVPDSTKYVNFPFVGFRSSGVLFGSIFSKKNAYTNVGKAPKKKNTYLKEQETT